MPLCVPFSPSMRFRHSFSHIQDNWTSHDTVVNPVRFVMTNLTDGQIYSDSLLDRFLMQALHKGFPSHARAKTTYYSRIRIFKKLPTYAMGVIKNLFFTQTRWAWKLEWLWGWKGKKSMSVTETTGGFQVYSGNQFEALVASGPSRKHWPKRTLKWGVKLKQIS